MSLKQREIKIKPRIKLNHNKYIKAEAKTLNTHAKLTEHLSRHRKKRV